MRKTQDFNSLSIFCVCGRIIVHGAALLKTITPFSATVFNYRKEFKLSKRSVSLSLCLSNVKEADR